MKDRRGFSLVELVVVLTVGGLLAAVAVNSFGTAQHRAALRSAESNLVALHSQTRALAVERGMLARLVIDAGTDQATVILDDGTTRETVRSLNFMDQYRVSLNLRISPAELCLGPRGIGHVTGADCQTNPTVVSFSRGGQTHSVLILPLGQVVR